MIFKCAGCDGVFGLTVHDPAKPDQAELPVIRAEYTVVEDRRIVNKVKETPVEPGLCPACALATMMSMDLDDAIHGVKIVNGRHP